ncbi:MAG: hypothetical protein WC307_06700 [Candidatus Nanoarchaeia archaeon]|jgi:hypothetical protein
MVPDTLSEICLCTVQPINGTAFNIHPIVTSFSIEGGEKRVEVQPFMDGSRGIDKIPQTEVTLSFDAYTIGIGTTTGDDISLVQHFENPNNLDVSSGPTDPILILNSNEIKKFRVSFLFTSDTTITSAHTSPTKGVAERITFANAVITVENIDFRDLTKKNTYKMVVPPFDINADPNIRHESSKDCAQATLPTLTNYTTTNKWIS